MKNNTAKVQVWSCVDRDNREAPYFVGYCDAIAKDKPETARVWVSDNADGSDGQYWLRGELVF